MQSSNRKICIIAIIVLTMSSYAWTQNIPVTGESREDLETKIYLFRHAERNKGLDPPLNKTGLERANLMAALLSDSGITAIYCTDLLRNRQTAAPLARILKIKVNVFSEPYITDARALADHFVSDVLPRHAGETILFIGNQQSPGKIKMGNLQELYWKLGSNITPLTRYYDYYTVILRADSTLFRHGMYGLDLIE